MLFSVIIPTYNRLELLKEALASVQSQGFVDYEVIVIDDGSTDGTAEALAEEGNRLRVLVQPNRGPGAARNLGAQSARGDYLAFLDSDDLWFPWTLSTFAELIQQFSKPSLVVGKILDFMDSAEVADVALKKPAGLALDCFLDSHGHDFFASANMMVVSRETFAAVGGFSEERINAEDHDLALRLCTSPGFVQVTDPITIGRRRHTTNETNSHISSAMGLNRLIMRERCGDYPGGLERRVERRRMITRYARPLILECISAGHLAEAQRLYGQTFLWNARDWRFKFIIAAPILMALRTTLRLELRAS
jgi:glycosyltransferase involved in cell wall biosynthesis